MYDFVFHFNTHACHTLLWRIVQQCYAKLYSYGMKLKDKFSTNQNRKQYIYIVPYKLRHFSQVFIYFLVPHMQK